MEYSYLAAAPGRIKKETGNRKQETGSAAEILTRNRTRNRTRTRNRNRNRNRNPAPTCNRNRWFVFR
jgi:hypothetical protein